MRATYLRRCHDWYDVGEKLLDHIATAVRQELAKPAAEAAAALLFLPVRIHLAEDGLRVPERRGVEPQAS